MGSFDIFADRLYPEAPGRRTGGPPATFSDAFSQTFDLAKQSTPFGGSLQLSDKYRERAKQIYEITGDTQLYIDSLGMRGDPRVVAREAEVIRRYPELLQTDDQILESLKQENKSTRERAAANLEHTTFGGTVGWLLGSMVGGVTYDPALWMSLPAGAPATAAVSVLRRGAFEAGINFASELASIAASSDWRKRMEDPITGDEFALRSFLATGIGGVVGAGAAMLKRLSAARKAQAIDLNTRPTGIEPQEIAEPRRIITLGEDSRVVPVSEYIEELRGFAGRDKKDLSLSQFIKKEGGLPISELPGEVRALMREKRIPGLFVSKAKNGQSIEELAELAHRAGYISEVDSQALLEAVRQDLTFGPVFPGGGRRFESDLDFDIRVEQAASDRLAKFEVIDRLGANDDDLATLIEFGKSSDERVRLAAAKRFAELYPGIDDEIRAAQALDQEFQRGPSIPDYITADEYDAAQVIDDWADIMRSSPYEQSQSMPNHVEAIGRAIADINEGRPVDVGEVARRPVTTADGTIEEPRLRPGLERGEDMAEPEPRFDDFPETASRVPSDSELDAAWVEVAEAAERDFVELIESAPDRQTGVRMGDSLTRGEAVKVVESIKAQEKEIAAIEACMTRGAK